MPIKAVIPKLSQKSYLINRRLDQPVNVETLWVQVHQANQNQMVYSRDRELEIQRPRMSRNESKFARHHGHRTDRNRLLLLVTCSSFPFTLKNSLRLFKMYILA